jgi:hypothetical protein
MSTKTAIEREIERVAERAMHESNLAGGAPLGILDGLEAFAAAIHFSEPLVVCIIVLHVLFLLTAVFTRKHPTVQMALLALALGSVLSASSLNELGRRHWKSLGITQNYFDPYGVFVSVMLSLPMILTSFVILINAVVRASKLLVVVKRKQLGIDKKQKALRDAQKQAAEAKGSSSSTAQAPAASSPSGDASLNAMSVGDVDGQSPSDGTSATKRRSKASAKTS